MRLMAHLSGIPVFGSIFEIDCVVIW